MVGKILNLFVISL